MSDESQIDVPASFVALYSDRSGRFTGDAAHLRMRYDVCEDLAQHLVEHALHIHRDRGLLPSEVIVRCHRGLLAASGQLQNEEAHWVAHRLAELLDWPWDSTQDFLSLAGGS